MIGKPSVSAGFTRIGSPALGVGQSEGGFDWDAYWASIKILWAKGRSGLTMPDDFGNDPIILPSYNTFNGSDDIARTFPAWTAATFVGKTSGTFCEAVIKVIDSEENYFFNLSNVGHAYKRMTFSIESDGKLRYYYRDGTFTRDIKSTNVIATGWHTVKIESSGGAYVFYLDNVSIPITVVAGSNDGVWNITAVAPSIASIGGYILSGGTTYKKANVARVKYGTTMEWVCNNNSYVFELITSDWLAGDGMPYTTFKMYGTGTKKVYGSDDDYVLDYGYSIFIKDASPDIEVPNKSDGSKLNAPITGYTESYVVNGSLTDHNLSDSYIRFLNDFFDRSNITIWNDTCRASEYYDAANTKDFHISEINFKTLIGYLNVGYAGRFFPVVSNNSITDRDLLEELILVSADLRRANEVSALTETGDIVEAVVDGSGNVLYDSNGYVLIN